MKPLTKKVLKTSESPKPKEEVVLPPPVPPVGPGVATIFIQESDLLTFANLMTICAKTFETLALDAAEKNDQVAFRVLQSRHSLSMAFAHKLAECVKMPEPISRDNH